VPVCAVTGLYLFGNLCTIRGKFEHQKKLNENIGSVDIQKKIDNYVPETDYMFR